MTTAVENISSEVVPVIHDIITSVEEFCKTNTPSDTSNTTTELDGHLHIFSTIEIGYGGLNYF